MSLVAAAENPEEKPFVVVRASDIEKTGSQVAVLCQILESCQPMLLQMPDTGTSPEVDKVAQAEARKSYEMAQVRIRDIIDDPRWDLKQTEAEKASQATLEANTAKNLASATLCAEMAKPHKLCNANIQLFPTIGWIAWIGEGLPTNLKLHGVGNSPAQAFAAFDRNYSQVTEIAKTVTVTPVSPTPNAPPKARTGSILRKRKKK